METDSEYVTVMDKHLDVVKHKHDGSVVLGASSLTGRYWTGSLWYYEDPGCVGLSDKCTSCITTEAGIADVDWVQDDIFVVASDSGALELWQLSEDRSILTNTHILYEHDDCIASVSVNSDANKAISGSADCRIKVWDVNQHCCVDTYELHTMGVNCVVCSPTQPDIFISCSTDGYVILWDLRNPKPAKILDKEPISSLPTCVTWKPTEENTLAIGDESGTIVVKDCRNLDSPIRDIQAHSREINRLAFSQISPSWLASVSNDYYSVVVTELVEGPPVKKYTSCDHVDFARGVSWSPVDNTLMTCGWDTHVLTHYIEQTGDGVKETDLAASEKCKDPDSMDNGV